VWRIILTYATLTVAFTILLTSGTVAAAESNGSLAEGGQPPEPTSALTVVETFLLARNSGDPSAATLWCASWLELQDVDGSWFVDPPTTSAWLRQLTGRYFVDTVRQPFVEGDTVSWTERLTRRGMPFADAFRSSIRVDVHAVIRDGKIAYLSGPYPPVPFRDPESPAGQTGIAESSVNSATVAPGTLFVGTAGGLSVVLLLAARGGPVLYRAVQQHSRYESKP
jgi:hypothetical protein